jgi:MoxR-like ATPase
VDSNQLSQTAQRVIEAVESAIVGKRETVELALAVLLSGGHLLIEDIPGVGKTTLAKALARALGLSFKRIQFTPDLLPSDITGSSVYNQKTGEFEMRPGPVFANIVLADEINRTTPKTQAALLECMEERQVTIDGVPHALPSPFFVLATQNNVELSGTYPLPEAQLDRFSARIGIGYPDRSAEMEILGMQRHSRPVDAVPAVLNAEEILELQSSIRDVYSKDIESYIVDIVGTTRTLPSVALGVSTRGAQHLLYATQAWAALQARTHVTPDDVKRLAPMILSHRIIVRPEQRVRGVTSESCVQEALNRVAVPVV